MPSNCLLDFGWLGLVIWPDASLRPSALRCSLSRKSYPSRTQTLSYNSQNKFLLCVSTKSVLSRVRHRMSAEVGVWVT
jgi:hypothetical protein